MKQLLTPAPNVAAVVWKRAKLGARDFSHLPTKRERVERMIDDDVAFLAAHPVRQSGFEAPVQIGLGHLSGRSARSEAAVSTQRSCRSDISGNI